MRAIGIVRRIDDLGRIAIPKEIRNALGLETGEQVELYTNKNGEIILKKYKKSWEDTVIEWWEKHRDEVYRYSNFSYECEYTFCVVRRPNDITRAGYAKKFYSDRNDSRIAQVAAYARAIGEPINELVGWEG